MTLDEQDVRDVIRFARNLTEAEESMVALLRRHGVLPEPCEYTHAHTRAWCGNSGCREA